MYIHIKCILIFKLDWKILRLFLFHFIQVRDRFAPYFLHKYITKLYTYIRCSVLFDSCVFWSKNVNSSCRLDWFVLSIWMTHWQNSNLLFNRFTISNFIFLSLFFFFLFYFTFFCCTVVLFVFALLVYGVALCVVSADWTIVDICSRYSIKMVKSRDLMKTIIERYWYPSIRTIHISAIETDFEALNGWEPSSYSFRFWAHKWFIWFRCLRYRA